MDYSTTITTTLTASAAFDGINNVAAWWAKELKGATKQLNDVFTVRFGETWATIRITEMLPGQKITWLVQDCYLDLLKDTSEWKGTKIIFDIVPKNGCSVISMTHIGLAPGKECYDDCVKGWDFFIRESLLNYLQGSGGAPRTGIHARIAVANHVYKGTLYAKSQEMADTVLARFVVDVKDNSFEEVTAAYSVTKYDENTFNLQNIKGTHYMILENDDHYNNIDVLTDLASIIK